MRCSTAAILLVLLAAPAAAQTRIVRLSDSYAPAMMPGEYLVPGSVYDVVPAPRAAPAPAPAPALRAAPSFAAPQSVPSSSCYSSGYSGGTPAYGVPSSAYAVPSYPAPPAPASSYRQPAYSTPEAIGPAYARPRRQRAPRVAGGPGWGLERERYSRFRLGLGGGGFTPFASGGILDRW